MDLNEFLTIDKDTTLDDLNIMINELDILILLCRKTLSLKKLDIKNDQYKKELLYFIKFKGETVNIGKFINGDGEMSLIEFSVNKPFLSDENINHKLSGIFYLDQEYWNDDRKEKFKAKILVINNRINILSHRLLHLFFIS